MAGVIDDYLAGLARDLAFDPELARRMVGEAQSHLREAAEADPEWPSADAERRAVERFGLAREIAAQCAVDAVDRQIRRSWVALLATVAMTFVAMRLRVIWLGEVGDTVSLIAPLIDRYTFIAALGVAAFGWSVFRYSLLPLAVAVAALVASIAAGICRAGLFLGAAAPLHVLLAAAVEIALVGLLAFHVVGLGRRLRRTALLRRAV